MRRLSNQRSNLRWIESLECRKLLSTAVLTYHNDNQSTGLNSTETQLTPGNVTVANFAKRFSTGVDGQVYAQPLYVPGLNITTGASAGVHNTVFVATQHNSLYAIDGDSGAILYQVSFIGTANGLPNATSVIPMPAGDTGSTDLSPEVGIVSTPVIDASTNSLYLTTKTKEIVNNDNAQPHYVYRLYKVNIQDGTFTKTIIGDTIRNTNTGVYTNNTTIYSVGNGDGVLNVGGQNRVYFNAMRAMNRPGLVLSNGEIFISFASHGDTGPYHGWVLAFNASTLAVTRALNTTPNGGLGGIWQGGGITAADPQGFFYFETGNGTFNTNPANFNAQGFPIDANYGDCFVKIGLDPASSITNQNPNGFGLKVVDYFSPFNNAALDSVDRDLGSGGPLILPDSAGSAAHPHLLVGAGKESKVYLIDRDNMGKFNPATDNVVQTLGNGIGTSGSFGTPAYYNGHFIYGGVNTNVRSFAISNAIFTQTSMSPDTIGALDGTISVSSNGLNNGIAWVIDRGSNSLKAYDASNLATQVWTSSMAPGLRDQLGSAVKFTVPTVADGHVYCGTASALVAYGPPVAPTSAPAAPTSLAATAASGIQINLTWNDAATNEDGYEVYQSTDNVNFTKVGTLSVNAQSFSANNLSAGTPYWFKVRAFNSFNGTSYSAYSNTATATTQSQVPNLNFSGGFAGAGATLNFNGSAKIVGTAAQLTDTTSTFQVGTVWSKLQQDIRRFSVNFTFTQSGTADGMTFAIQRASATAQGGVGGNLGYGGIGTSVAIKFDLYPTVSDTGLYQNGATPDAVGTQTMLPNITLQSAHLMNCSLIYNGTTLTQTVTDTVSGGVYTRNYTVNIPTVIGGNNAYVGFTGATGGELATQQIKTWSFVTLPSTPPTGPSGLTGTPASGTQINLSWTDNATTEDGYKIFRKAGAGGTFAQVGSVGANVTMYIDTALDPNVDYYYQVYATNFAGDSSGSNIVQVRTPVPPVTPTDAHATIVTTNQIQMAWTDNANNELGFKILRKTGSAEFGEIADLPANTTTYIDNGPGGLGLLPGTEYDYHIQEYNIAGYSDFTGFTMQTRTLAPTNLQAAVSQQQISLTWTAPANNLPSGAVTYRVYRGTVPGGAGAVAVASDLPLPAFADSTAVPGTMYYYSVTASTEGGESAKSGEAFAIIPADVIPPGVVSSIFNFQSSPTQLIVQFSEDVSASLSLADITVMNLNTTSTANPVALAYDALSNTATFSFAAGAPENANYLATIAATGVSDAAGNPLDGDGNSTAGGDWNFSFYFLNADANRDRKVDTQDFNVLAGNFGASSLTFAQGNFDFDATGTIDSADFNVLTANYGKQMPAPASVMAATNSPASGPFATAGPILPAKDWRDLI